MEKLLFKDGQTLQVQSITATNGTLRVNVINNSYEQLKHLFTDPLTTGRIAVEGEDGREAEVFENYTIFSFIRENAGGIFIVEMQQDGEDTDTKLEKLKTDMEKLKEQSNPLINSAVLVAQIQAQFLTDEQSLEVKDLYPTFDELAESGYTAAKQGYKFRDGDDLYKTAQDNVTFQAQYRPGTGTESLYTHIDEAHAGTLEDPIPVPDTVTTAGMEYEYGKYYSENGTVYLCKRGGVENPEEMYGQKETLYYAPSKMVGQYFEEVE